MKKAIVLIVVVLAMVSCKKNYNCECVTTPNTGNTGSITTNNQNIMSKKKADAIKDCDALDEHSTSFTTECSIK